MPKGVYERPPGVIGEEGTCRTCGKSYIRRLNRALRCASCVGKDTRARAAALARDVKEANPCAICGEDDPIVLQYHHVDPATKWRDPRNAGTPKQATGVSGLIGKNRSWRAVAAELEKCVVLCANCHLRVEAGTESLAGIPTLKVSELQEKP